MTKNVYLLPWSLNLLLPLALEYIYFSLSYLSQFELFGQPQRQVQRQLPRGRLFQSQRFASPPTRQILTGKLPEFDIFGGGEGVIGKRKFVRTPSLGAAIRFQEFGIRRARRTRGEEVSGLFEREFGLEGLPQIQVGSLLGEVRRTGKRKGNKKRRNKK